MKTVLLFLSLPVLAFAQDTSGILEGRITGPAGGSVPGATVRLTNTATGFTRTQQTPGTGSYHVALPPGEYDLTVEAPNFALYRRKAVPLSVSQTDVALTVARDKDSITLSAETPLVGSDD